LVAILVLAIGLPSGGDGKNDLTEALTDVATAAAAQNAVAGDSSYLYLKTRSLSVDTAVAQGEAWSVYRSETRQEWSSLHGEGLVRIEDEPATFVGAGDRAAWEAAGSPNFADLEEPTRVSEKALPAGSIESLAGLSTDPDALADQLRVEAEATHKSAPIPARTLELIGEALRNPTAPPELRAALYEAAIQTPGIEYLGPEVDPNGRNGLAIGVTSSYSGSPTLFSLVYDPESAAVLANEQTTLEPEFADADAPIVTSATVYLGSGSIDSLPNS
jgi:hypothetical protein